MPATENALNAIHLSTNAILDAKMDPERVEVTHQTLHYRGDSGAAFIHLREVEGKIIWFVSYSTKVTTIGPDTADVVVDTDWFYAEERTTALHRMREWCDEPPANDDTASDEHYASEGAR